MDKYLDISLDEKFTKINSFTWLPFIGKEYLTSENKTLILGESHYVPLDEDPEFYLDKTWTRQFILKEGLQIKPWNQSEKKNNLIREIEKTLIGRLNNDFWQNVAYFNLIQRLLPSINGQDRPTYIDIKNGLELFKNIINLFNPDKIIFCGIEASKHFKHLLNDENFQIDEYKCPNTKINGTYPKSFKLNYNGKIIFCYFIKHPSMSYTAEKWRQFIFEKEEN